MRIGIVADIHEAIDPLEQALAAFRAAGVDQVVTLGDACDTFSPVGRSQEVVALLRDAGAIGVWGNHDIGLCYEVPEKLRLSTSPDVLEFMSRMQSQLVVDGCRFSHVEPWLDAYKVEHLWYFDGPPDTPEKAARSFAAVPERHLFVGHFHRWLVMTPAGPIAWEGQRPLNLNTEGRYLVVVAAVANGWCAIFESGANALIPVRCGM